MKTRKHVIFAIILLVFVLCVMIYFSYGCAETVGTARTNVYVRSADGKVVGTMTKGETAVVKGIKNGWAKIIVNDEAYKVWSEFLDFEIQDEVEESELMHKVTDSPSMGKIDANGVYKNTITEHKIKGSEFEGKHFMD